MHNENNAKYKLGILIELFTVLLWTLDCILILYSLGLDLVFPLAFADLVWLPKLNFYATNSLVLLVEDVLQFSW